MAILFGLLGGATTFIYLGQARTSAASAQAEVVPVVVAAGDLTFGTVIGPEHLLTVPYPAGSVPAGAYSTPDSLVGQTTKVFVTAKEPILATKLSSVGGGLSIKIPVNMRATSMNVNVVSGVSGFVLPGDRVDVLVVIDRAGETQNAVTRTILQNIEVLAAGQKTEVKGDNPVKVQSVTLIVDPEGAEKLALALHEGKLHLVLRNPADHEIAQVRSFSTNEMLSDRAPAPKAAPVRMVKAPAPAKETPRARPTVTLIRGVKVEEQTPAVDAGAAAKSPVGGSNSLPGDGTR
jgi:pilus assembly protein CpaB